MLCVINNWMKYSCLRKLMSRTTNVNASMDIPIPILHAAAEPLAKNLLQQGNIIAVPTDTVYGLACCATNLKAINKLYLIKTRNENKPLAICVGKVDDVQRWALVEHLPKGLLSALLPGPVTLVLCCANKLDKSLSFNGKVGIRVPNYQFIQNIANDLNFPIALTSANISNEPSSIRVEEFKPLWEKVSGIFDGGVLGFGDSNRGASTVVDLSEAGFYKILRLGVAANQTTNILRKYGLKDSL